MNLTSLVGTAWSRVGNVVAGFFGGGSPEPIPTPAPCDYSVTGLNELSISSYSSLTLTTIVWATTPGGDTLDPSASIVSFAFLPLGTQPSSSTVWVAGAWSESGAGFAASILVGPEGTPLSTGEYAVWLQIIATPEEIILPVSTLTVF